MGDGPAEWPLGRPVLVDVNPLVVARGICEGVDPVLVDHLPLADTDLGANERHQLIMCCHVGQPTPARRMPR